MSEGTSKLEPLGRKAMSIKENEGQKRLLAIFAHPDDESFGTGGTLAHYAGQGVRVGLVCATRGEAGEISDPTLATPENLAQVREQELRCAAQTLGVRDLFILDYRDSGMAGTPENEHPRALVQADAEKVVGELVGVLRRFRPQVVITFEPNGGYGHPDHIAIHKHAVAAFHAAAEPTRFPQGGEPWQAERLYYTAIPRSFYIKMRDHLVAAGVDINQFERFENGVIGWPDEDITAIIDVSDCIDTKWQALNCHRTQFGAENLFRTLPDDVLKKMMSREHFAQAWPEPERGCCSADLFTDG